MAIIAVMVALILPAMVGARSASRRINCMNNLKQIELALQSYLYTYNVLPSGSYDAVRPVSSEPGGYKLSWIVSILPYMEQSGVYRAFDFQYGADDPANQTPRMSWINSLLCPDDGSAGHSWYAGWTPPARGSEPGRSSYAACHHDVEAPIDEDNHGVFFLNSHVRVTDVADGLVSDDLRGRSAVAGACGMGLGNPRDPPQYGTPDQRRHRWVSSAARG